MANLPLSFPVYYCCAIRGFSSLNQHDIINVLFRGQYYEECGAEAIVPTICSVYTNGKRSLTRELIAHISQCPREELIRRFELLGIQDYEKSADNLKQLLISEKPLGQSALENLLALAENPDPLPFLVEIFILAVKCPGKHLEKLSNSQQELLSQGQFSAARVENCANTTGGKATDSKKSSRAANEFERFRSEYDFRQQHLVFPDDEAFITRCAESFISGRHSEGENRPPVIPISEATFQQFMACLPKARKIWFTEVYGTYARLSTTLRMMSLPRDHAAFLLLFDASPEVGMHGIQKLPQQIAEYGNDSVIAYGIRVSGQLENTAVMQMFHTDNRDDLAGIAPRPSSRRADYRSASVRRRK